MAFTTVAKLIYQSKSCLDLTASGLGSSGSRWSPGSTPSRTASAPVELHLRAGSGPQRGFRECRRTVRRLSTATARAANAPPTTSDEPAGRWWGSPPSPPPATPKTQKPRTPRSRTHPHRSTKRWPSGKTCPGCFPPEEYRVSGSRWRGSPTGRSPASSASPRAPYNAILRQDPQESDARVFRGWVYLQRGGGPGHPGLPGSPPPGPPGLRDPAGHRHRPGSLGQEGGPPADNPGAEAGHPGRARLLAQLVKLSRPGR